MGSRQVIRLEVSLSAGLTALIDQLSKALAHGYLSHSSPRPVLQGIFYLTYTENTGAAFGLFKGSGFILTGVSFFFLLLFSFLGSKVPLDARLMRLALGCGLGGALSNLLDRLTKGYVVDFIDFRFWPVFNLADIAIVLGLGIICWRLVFTHLSTEGE